MKSDFQKGTGQYEIPEFLKKTKQDILPNKIEQYLDFYRELNSEGVVQGARKTFSVFNRYLQESNISLCKISIGQVDQFLAIYNKGYAPGTCRTHRSYLRKFFKHLYLEGYIKKDIAPLIISPPEFARSKPPKFLRPEEIQKLFNSLDLSFTRDLRTNATMHLAYYLGLRPKEIRLITLDDISFRLKEIFIRSRKNYSPAQLPLPDVTIKAIIAYIVGGRPVSECRVLFLQKIPPYNPVNENDIPSCIRKCMKKNNLSASTYWLRHSYAQSLLESGASIYEIKEMMGHKTIGSTHKYLSIHVNLMREIILDETV
jgi:integrase/recombinase XerD